MLNNKQQAGILIITLIIMSTITLMSTMVAGTLSTYKTIASNGINQLGAKVKSLAILDVVEKKIIECDVKNKSQCEAAIVEYNKKVTNADENIEKTQKSIVDCNAKISNYNAAKTAYDITIAEPYEEREKKHKNLAISRDKAILECPKPEENKKSAAIQAAILADLKQEEDRIMAVDGPCGNIYRTCKDIKLLSKQEAADIKDKDLIPGADLTWWKNNTDPDMRYIAREVSSPQSGSPNASPIYELITLVADEKGKNQAFSRKYLATKKLSTLAENSKTIQGDWGKVPELPGAPIKPVPPAPILPPGRWCSNQCPANLELNLSRMHVVANSCKLGACDWASCRELHNSQECAPGPFTEPGLCSMWAFCFHSCVWPVAVLDYRVVNRLGDKPYATIAANAKKDTLLEFYTYYSAGLENRCNRASDSVTTVKLLVGFSNGENKILTFKVQRLPCNAKKKYAVYFEWSAADDASITAAASANATILNNSNNNNNKLDMDMADNLLAKAGARLYKLQSLPKTFMQKQNLDLPLIDNNMEFNNAYVLVNRELYFVKRNGVVDKINIFDPNKFSRGINKIGFGDRTQVYLTADQVKELITDNSGHTPQMHGLLINDVNYTRNRGHVNHLKTSVGVSNNKVFIFVEDDLAIPVPDPTKPPPQDDNWSNKMYWTEYKLPTNVEKLSYVIPDLNLGIDKRKMRLHFSPNPIEYYLGVTENIDWEYAIPNLKEPDGPLEDTTFPIHPYRNFIQ